MDFLRTKSISENVIYFQAGMVYYNLSSGIDDDIEEGKASLDSYYGAELIEFNKEELRELKDRGAIKSIERY